MINLLTSAETSTIHKGRENLILRQPFLWIFAINYDSVPEENLAWKHARGKTSVIESDLWLTARLVLFKFRKSKAQRGRWSETRKSLGDVYCLLVISGYRSETLTPKNPFWRQAISWNNYLCFSRCSVIAKSGMLWRHTHAPKSHAGISSGNAEISGGVSSTRDLTLREKQRFLFCFTENVLLQANICNLHWYFLQCVQYI